MPMTEESSGPMSGWRPDERVDLIGIGVQKAGTTWLFQCLAEHPGVRIARSDNRREKEINFFNRYWERGYHWYHEKFEFGPWRTAEFSVLYFHDRDVPPRIHQYHPQAKLLLALRDPVVRALSHHRHEVRQGRLAGDMQRFETALAANPSYLDQGQYGFHLERWLEWFPVDRLHVVDYHDIATDPAQVMEAAYVACGLDRTFRPPSLERRVNRSTRVRSPTLARLARAGGQFVRRTFGEAGRRAMSGSGLPARVRELNEEPIAGSLVPETSRDTEKALATRFEDSTRRLEKILGRSFEHWTRP